MTAKAVFLGTPVAAVPSLESLAEIAAVPLVITRPDRPRGRSKTPLPSPVALAARERGLALRQPRNRDELRRALEEVTPVDVAVVVAFGMLIPADVLTMPAHGFVNVHFSLLPRWRGAAPVQRAIAEGDARTGVTLMRMDEGLDTGGIIAQAHVEIGPDDTTDTLTNRLAILGAHLLEEQLADYLEGRLRVRQQSSTGMTYAAKVLPEEARIDFFQEQHAVDSFVRAMNPKPGAHARHGTDRIKVWKVGRRSLASLAPGELEVVGGELLVGTNTAALALLEIQPAGKRRMAGHEWARGRQGELGRLT